MLLKNLILCSNYIYNAAKKETGKKKDEKIEADTTTDTKTGCKY